ncbi:DUF945 family protein [Candidatus Albibeggiatoa sp. nov. NOAA]|uniref:DUF945 family protein n=1 Tax=Candidatus Albibeggiatoa sp. nov. NOAA TaxID=3162724 RepID=UPI0032FD1347|nr:DUF945 family protein [Thiotrichaceae bacterium]
MKLLPRFVLICGVYGVSAHSIATEQTIFIEHQISQEIAVEELSEQSEKKLPQILWQNFSSAIKHLSELYADIHKKNEDVDMSTKVQSFLQLPEHKAFGSLPAVWVETIIGADGGGEVGFEIPSYWYRVPDEFDAGIIDWNGLSGSAEFHPKFTSWQGEVDMNGFVLDAFEQFKLEFDPSYASASYSLNQDAKPALETKFNIPAIEYESEEESEKLTLEYFQLKNTFLPEQYLPTALNTTLDKFCYQQSVSDEEGEQGELFNLFGLAAEFKIQDTGAKLINLPPQTSLIDLLEAEDSDKLAEVINIMAFRPTEANAEFKQLTFHEAGFQGNNACKPSEKPLASLDAYQDDFVHLEINDFEYNGQAKQQESGLILENGYFHLGQTMLKGDDVATRFEKMKFAYLSNLQADAPNLVETSVNIDVDSLDLPQVLTDKEELNLALSFGLNRLDAEALTELQQFAQTVTMNMQDQEDPSMFMFSLMGKYMELAPKFLQQSPEIFLKGLKDEEQFSLALNEKNQLVGSFNIGINNTQPHQLLDPQALIKALYGDMDIELKLTQDKANLLMSYLFEVDDKEAAEMVEQWVSMFSVTHEGDDYTLTVDLDLKDGQLVGNNDTSKMIAGALQPFISMTMGE